MDTHSVAECVTAIKELTSNINRQFYAYVLLSWVVPLCKTATGGPENYEASLMHWIKYRQYSGNETADELAAMWDAR